MASSSSLIGRERELARLRQGLDDAVRGRGRLFLVSGEPGIGKSRLVDELADHARGHGAMVLWGRCWEAGGAPAYWPWVQAMRTYVRDLDPDRVRALAGKHRGDLAQILPELEEATGAVERTTTMDPEGARFRLFDSTTTFLRAAAADAPLVIILEDLHAADTPSMLLLQFVARELSPSRLLMIGTYRDTEIVRDHPHVAAIAELLREPATERIAIAGLGSDEVSRLIEVTAERVPAAGLVTAVHKETEGNPLFVGEIVRLLAAEGRLDRSGSTTMRLGVPEGIRAVILRRFGHLSFECSELLQRASIIGHEFGLDILERLSRIERAELVDLLGEAGAAGVVTEVALGRMRFAHALFREALYEEMQPGERVRLHRTTGEILEAQYGDDPGPHLAELAHHFFDAARGGDALKALTYARRAGERAAQLLAYEESVRLHGMALEALDLHDQGDEATRGQLLLAMGDAQARAGAAADAKATFLAVAELARRLGDAELLSRAALGRGGRFVWERAGNDPHLISLHEDALRAIGPGDHPLRVRLLARLACALRSQHAQARSDALSREAVEMAERLGDRSALAYALDGRYGAIWWPDNSEQRLEIADRMLEVAKDLDDKEISYQGHHCRWTAAFELGDMVGVRAELEAMERLGEELRQPSQRWVAGAARALLALLEGRFREAEDFSEEALERGSAAQLDAISAFRAQTYAIKREEGRLPDVEDVARRSVEEFPWYAIHATALAMICVETGRVDEARGILDAMAADDFAGLLWDNEWLLALAWIAQLCAMLGDADRASVVYRLLKPHERPNVLGHGEGCAGSASRYLGLTAAVAGRTAEAAKHFEAAIAHNARLGARPFVAHTQHEYAEMLARSNDATENERARVLVAEASVTARELGMPALEGKLDALATTLGLASLRPSEPSPPAAPSAMNEFVREGEYWSVAYDGPSFRIRDSKGVRYLATLLASPAREFHVLDLVGHGGAGSVAAREDDLAAGDLGDAGEILDPEAKAAYRSRLAELDQTIEEARSWGDGERAARAVEEREALVQQLAGAVGLGGRDRKAASASERARVNVTRAIKAAVARLAEQSPPLGAHLDATLRTGTFCSYTPDPRSSPAWKT
ncbi:MAG: AAA family ATPase [Actinomycetota bacterium]